jgi:hypothetical protein
MKIGSYGNENLDFMTRRPHDDIFTETFGYVTFSPSIYDVKLMIIDPPIHSHVSNILSIMLVTYWCCKGVVTYEYVMTMRCTAQNPSFAKSQEEVTTNRTLVLYVLFQAYVGIVFCLRSWLRRAFLIQLHLLAMPVFLVSS